MKCLFLYNPKSGKEKIKKNLEYILKRLKEKFDVIDVHPSKSREDFIEQAKNSCGKYDYLVFSGGDGSYNLVVNAIADEENQPILGYIPSGTCNDIAHNMNIPSKSIRKCLDIILNNDYIEHDIFKVNNEYCMYVAALGDFAELSYSTEHNVKKIFGRIAYYFTGLRKLLHKPQFNTITIEMDGVPYQYQTPLCLVMNSKCVAGFKINNHGYLNDGYIDIIIVNGIKIRGLFNIARLFIAGILKLKTEKASYSFRCKNIKIISSEDKHWSFDGEEGLSGELNFECVPKKIKVITNAK